MQPTVLDLNEVAHNVERLLQHTLGEHVELEARLQESLWPTKADRGQLEQVLVNLAVNARDAMPRGGKLILETANVIVDSPYMTRRPSLVPGQYVRLRVSDTGTGMTREVLEKAFDPFFTTKPKGEGTGLGLATVYGIVKQAAGDIEIYSEPGIGTTISLLLPITREALTGRVSPVAPAHGGHETILLVEDEPAMREVTRRVLAHNGYHVITASGGSEALRALADHDGPLDLLITDVIMPGMLGEEVAERVTATRANTKVRYMSGYAQPVLTTHGTINPGVALIEKPFSEHLLLTKVREALD